MEPSRSRAIARFCEGLLHVVKLRELPVRDLVELRLAVETAAFARTSTAPVGAHLDEAGGHLQVMRDVKTPAAEFYDADVSFHVALVAASGNQALLVVMLAVKDAIKARL